MHTLHEWLTYLETTTPSSSFIYRDLERIKKVAQHLNINTTNAKVITVTGTNGKGSCSEMLTSVYTQAGYKVGTYTSPHLFHFNERIRIQKQPINDKRLCEAFSYIEQTKKDTHLTYFEFITLAALYIFKQEQVDIIILEVGIGGRLDATNILDADLAIITSIGMDHMAYLGNTRGAIAREKAGIFRERQLSVCGEPFPPNELMEMASKLRTKVSYVGKDFHYEITEKLSWNFNNEKTSLENLPMPVLALNNAAVVLQAILLAEEFLPINLDNAIQSITTTKLAGRCEIQQLSNGGVLIFDVAHNPQAALQLAHFIQQYKNRYSVKKTMALFSMLNDKDIENTISVLKTQIDEWHTFEISYPRRASREQLQAAFDTHQIIPAWHNQLNDAFDKLKSHLQPEELLIIFGSFFVVTEILTAC